MRSHSLPKINIKCFVRKGGLVLVALLFITNYILDRDGLLFLPLFVYPVALYTTTDSGYAPNCCLANHLLRTLGRVEKGCSLARVGDWVLLPPDLDIGGAFRTELNVFTDDAVEELGRLAKDLLHCNLVSSSSVPSSVTRVSYGHRNKFSAHPVLRAWLASALSLPPLLKKAVLDCGGGNLSSTAAVHMRIESDWYTTAYSKNKDVPYCVMKQAEEGRWFCYSPAEILRLVKNSRDEMNAQALILLYSQPAEQFAEGTGEGPIETAKRMFPDLQIHHKSTSKACTAALSDLSYNAQAYVDLWIAVNSRIFIGTPDQSSFSSLAKEIRRGNGQETLSYSAVQRGKATVLLPCGVSGERCGLHSKNFLRRLKII
ncbi:hypothetical protein TrVE_jg2822 [Triparma verrucosa]|uniref:O-fucosyltransferase family protein n=1 Tax=Triparma verrucosa TaxID=1606542 RepID=A0A9W7EP28_9STRA|nr:hypothetical protein TrVE_jg2822 [Triparma verrucosa]